MVFGPRQHDLNGQARSAMDECSTTRKRHRPRVGDSPQGHAGCLIGMTQTGPQHDDGLALTHGGDRAAEGRGDLLRRGGGQNHLGARQRGLHLSGGGHVRQIQVVDNERV